MAIFLLCSCEHKIKVRDELAGRKVKCPECGKVIVVPELEDDEAPRRKRPPPLEEDDDAPRKKPQPALDNDADDGPPVKKGKSIFSKDVNELDRAFNNFDIARFTLIGWLLFVVAFAVGMLCFFVVEMNYERMFGPRGPGPISFYWVPHSIAGAIGGLGTFFGLWGLLHLLGVTVVRPKEAKKPIED
jgi:hypothetical protein